MGLPFPLPTGRGGLGGIGGLVILIVVLVVFGRGLVGGDGGFGVTPIDPFPEASAPSSTQGAPDDTFELVRFVSRDVQDFWQEQFQAAGKDYRRSTVVIFTGGTGTGCGAASASTGPFYCPLDQRVYLDLSFFNVLDRRLGAPGDFAQAYVVAHEIAHHVQRAACSRPETSRRVWGPRPPSATIVWERGAGRAGHTARRSFAWGGSARASTPATSTAATRSRATSDRGGVLRDTVRAERTKESGDD
jgi:hypothetical protein